MLGRVKCNCKHKINYSFKFSLSVCQIAVTNLSLNSDGLSNPSLFSDGLVTAF